MRFRPRRSTRDTAPFQNQVTTVTDNVLSSRWEKVTPAFRRGQPLPETRISRLRPAWPPGEGSSPRRRCRGHRPEAGPQGRWPRGPHPGPRRGLALLCPPPGNAKAAVPGSPGVLSAVRVTAGGQTPRLEALAHRHVPSTPPWLGGRGPAGWQPGRARVFLTRGGGPHPADGRRRRRRPSDRVL